MTREQQKTVSINGHSFWLSDNETHIRYYGQWIELQEDQEGEVYFISRDRDQTPHTIYIDKPPVKDELLDMPEWNKDNYNSFREWAKDCYKAGYSKKQAEMEKLYQALEGLCKEIHLGKLNIRKDFSLINAHAYANKVLHNAKTIKP